LLWLLIASALVCAGLALTYLAKSHQVTTGLDLRKVERREQLLPLLDMFPDAKDRLFAAGRVFEYLNGHAIPNVGALGRLEGRGDSGRLFTTSQLLRLKPRVVVRDLGSYRWNLLLWCGLFFAAFYAVHAFWVVSRFHGEWALLPVLHLLTGIGLILMVSLRDPLRDSLSFVNFAQGVLAGCVVLAAMSQVDWERVASGFSYIPLLGAILLSALLIVFGSGPGLSDAKVNLFGMQPVEII
jgi:hypothetical protein